MRNIETIRDRDILLQELKRQNMDFNISNFYLDESNTSVMNRGAIEIVTPDHDLACFANQSHMLAAKNIFRLFYDDFDDFTGEVWQEESCNRGNVLFQFCPTSFSIVWIPNKITAFQLRKISFVSAMFDVINAEMLKDESLISNSLIRHEINGKDRYISLETNIQDSDGRILSLEEAIPKIKSRVLTLKK